MSAEGLPLIMDYRPGRVFAWRAGGAVTCSEALAHTVALASRLDPGRRYLNLCEDRYRFTVAFAAVCLAGATNLLPQSRAAGSLDGVRESQGAAGDLDDEAVAAALAEGADPGPPDDAPRIPADHLAAVVFTSGSTGRPTPHAKYWGDLQTATRLFMDRFLPGGARPNVVATVPPQHMYGLETSVLPALQAGLAAHAGRPFMPWDLVEALAQVEAPRLLVTTPVHLRACRKAGIEPPPLELVISATAPLEAGLARDLESAWLTEVREIYGCTEAGSLASRRPGEDTAWQLYDGMTLEDGSPCLLHGPQLPEAVPLHDRLELLADGRFRLLGRSGDMLKLAGKRLSLAELSQRLLGIDGVEDAAVFLPEGRTDGRAAALVVAPALDERHIASALAELVDPVFVPRPLLRVDELPRNEVGKLPRRELEALLQRARGGR